MSDIIFTNGLRREYASATAVDGIDPAVSEVSAARLLRLLVEVLAFVSGRSTSTSR